MYLYSFFYLCLFLFIFGKQNECWRWHNILAKWTKMHINILLCNHEDFILNGPLKVIIKELCKYRSITCEWYWSSFRKEFPVHLFCPQTHVPMFLWFGFHPSSACQLFGPVARKHGLGSDQWERFFLQGVSGRKTIWRFNDWWFSLSVMVRERAPGWPDWLSSREGRSV